MGKATASVLTIEDLPMILKGHDWSKKPIGKLTRDDRKEIANIIYVKDAIIHPTNSKIARLIKHAMKEKRELGFCVGFLYCLNFVGFDGPTICSECKAQKENPRYHQRQSTYGRLRIEDRKREKQLKLRGYSK